MATPSPICTVQDGAGSAQSTLNGVEVTPANTVTIALAATAGVDVWTLACIGTDETSSVSAVNTALTVNHTTKTATITAPDAGTSWLFRSTVRSSGSSDSYSTTFKVCTLTDAELRVGALGETTENSATYGWVSLVNAAIRGGGGGGGGDVPSSRTLTAGAGLTGGGTLAADRTFNVVANADASIVVNANDIQVGVISDAQHGTRGGGTTHANANGSTAGFMTAALYIIANNFVAQAKSANFTVSAARYQQFTVDVNAGDVTATLPTSSRAEGDLVVFDIINASTNKLILGAADSSLPAEFSSSSSATLNVTSLTAGNGGRCVIRWDGSSWRVVDHPRLRWMMAEYSGYGLDAGYWVSPIHRWEPKDALDRSLRTQQIDIATTTNATPLVVSSRTHSTASRMVVAKMVARAVNTASAEAVEIRCSAIFRKGSSGDLAQIGATNDEGKVPTATALTWAATIGIGSTNVIDFTVTGEASKTIKWFVSIETSDCKYA
jgi:hypothetical protein